MSEFNHTLPEVLNVVATDNEATIEIYTSAELDYFKGHFPTAPVLPGVVQLEWAVHYAKQLFAIEAFPVKDIEVLKFQMVIQPELSVKLFLVRKSAHKITFKYISEKGTHASGRIVLEEV